MYLFAVVFTFFFFSSRRRHTRCSRDWSSDVCSSDLVGDGEDGVAARWHGFAAHGQIRVGDERGRFVRAGAPHLPVRDQPTVNFASVHARAGVVHGNRLAAGELAIGFGRWAGTLALIPLAQDGGGQNSET